ncbi:MAG: acyl-CoA thioesterase [Bdellovibrionota bacterium]|jgi:acyl-CoA thioesterase YciA|nr:acyl-CoA thioesterase [Bdellovibrionota bacterium]
MMNEKDAPTGELTVRTMAMPRDTNPIGDIFGGYLLSQMDIAGGIYSQKIAKGRTVTIAVDSMTFYKPLNVGDVLCCYCDTIKIGRTSIAVKVEAWTIRKFQADREKITEGVFTYVAIDDNSRPRPIKEES